MLNSVIFMHNSGGLRVEHEKFAMLLGRDE